jgi:hypothetical protein
MSSLRFIALFGCLVAASLCAQTTYIEPAKPGTPEAAVKGTLEVARSGNEVILTWTLPEGEARALEIYRNTHSDVKGRGRAGSIRADATVFHDKVPDDQTYWYWVKITRPNGVIVNLGPVATPSAAVWTP